MKQYTEIQVVRISKEAKQKLTIIESKGYNISHFIRLAIERNKELERNRIYTENAAKLAEHYKDTHIVEETEIGRKNIAKLHSKGFKP